MESGKGKESENVPKLESVKVVLVHCNLVKNNYQHTSKVLLTFVSNKQFGQLSNITTFFNDNEHNQYWNFFRWSLVYRPS